jgi:lysyl-tRNA synthetase class 2
MSLADWQPTATLAALQTRAKIIQTIREFFIARNVLEVETPTLSHATVTDLHLHSLQASSPLDTQKYYLQTSPEFAMKRLLAAYDQSIFQIGKAFRASEQGRLHNVEFTILEWYRVGFDHHQLMDEMD